MEEGLFPYETIFFVCTNTRDEKGRTACANAGRCGAKLRDALKTQVALRGLKGRVRVSASGCMDVCEEGPNVMVFSKEGRVWYKGVAEEDVPALLAAHLPPAI